MNWFAEHPWVTAHVVATVLTTIYFVRLTRSHVALGATSAEMRWALAILYGIVYPVFWTLQLWLLAMGKRRAMSALQEQGYEPHWQPDGCWDRIPGLPDDYPPVPFECVRSGRQIGRWYMLLVEAIYREGEWHEGGWSTIAGLGDECTIYVCWEFADGKEAHQAYRWTTESELDDELGKAGAEHAAAHS